MTKILIIDDDPDFTFATKLYLEEAGYEVCAAQNGTEGLNLVKQECPDLIILDVMMDTTTEGFQLALTLRSRAHDSAFKDYRHIPIIMQTSVHSTTPVRFGPDEDYLPIERFLDKPVDPAVLVETVKELVR